jgi:transposase, IS30 family
MYMAMPIRHPYSQIGIEERRKIERWRAAKVSVDEIAEKLGRHRSTIFRELRRNSFDDVEMPTFAGYYCVTVDHKARKRRYNLRKLIRLPKLRDAIIERIKHGWSPEQIAGRLKLDSGFDRGPVMYACHETIYRYAYSQDGHVSKLWRHLPEHRARVVSQTVV